MLLEYLKIIDERHLHPETINDQKEIFNKTDKCHSADLCKLFDDRVIYLSYWLAPQCIATSS